MTYFCSSFPGSPSSQAIEAATTITVVFPHLSELTLKIGVQFATHRTDQSKLFPVNVLLPYARASYPSHWAISGCFVQIRTASVVQAAEPVLREFNPSSSNQRTGPALRSGCQRCANFLPPWCSAMFRRQHLFVGSGVFEAGCKTVTASRLKRSGMFWTVRGANAILALR